MGAERTHHVPTNTTQTNVYTAPHWIVRSQDSASSHENKL
jgi:hypothetical protein